MSDPSDPKAATENPDKTAAADAQPATQSETQPEAQPETGLETESDTPRLDRRLLIFRATVLLGGAGVLGYYYYSRRRVRSGYSDNDPNDPQGGGRRKKKGSKSDNDPNDP